MFHICGTKTRPLFHVPEKETLLAPCEGSVFYKARTPLINEQTLAFQIVPLNIGDTVNQDRRGNFLDPEA